MRRIKKKQNTNSGKFWDGFYSENEESSLAARRQIYYEHVDRYLEDGKHSLLDIGCGFGNGLAYIQSQKHDYNLNGCDLSSIAIEKAQKYHRDINFFVFDIYKDSLNKLYDYILIIETLEHIEKPYKQIDKILKFCNRLIISMPYMSTLKKDPEHIITNVNEDSFSRYNVLDTSVWNKTDRPNKKYITVMLEG